MKVSQNCRSIWINGSSITTLKGHTEDTEIKGELLCSLFNLTWTMLDKSLGCTADKCTGLIESMAEVFPRARYQRCVVHFYRNIFSVVPRKKVKDVAAMLKAIHAQEDKAAALKKIGDVTEKLQDMKLYEAAKKVEVAAVETLTYMDFPREHWRRIRTNNAMERLNREIRRRTKSIGAFPDGRSAMMLVCARLRHVEQSEWSQKTYLNMQHLEDCLPGDS